MTPPQAVAATSAVGSCATPSDTTSETRWCLVDEPGPDELTRSITPEDSAQSATTRLAEPLAQFLLHPSRTKDRTLITHQTHLYRGGLPSEVEGVPLWKRDDGACYVATTDMDLLQFIDAALVWFDHMSGTDFHEFVARNRNQPAPGSIPA